MSSAIIVLSLILLNGIFAMSEIAIISARKSHLESDSKKGNKNARTALRLATDPDIFLSTIQIGITLIGILTGIFSGDALAITCGKLFIQCGIPASIAIPSAQTAIIIIVTYLTIVLGELVPKRIGLAAADKVARIMARPVYWLSLATKPFVWLLAHSTAVIVRISGVNQQDNKVTEEEIKSIIQEGTDDGEVKKVEQDIVERVFLMGDLKVSSIMTHRKDICWIDINSPHSEIKEILSRELHDNYPVADGSLDKIIGIVSLKELIRHNNTGIDLNRMTRQAPAFHENMSIYDGLERLKKEDTIGCALVFDEFGRCEGIITLRDILEGLIGTVNSKHDEPQIIPRGNNEGWLVDGQCPFYDFLIYFENEDITDDTDYNTVSGLILSRLGHIPISGESINWRDFTFEVIDMDGARIDKILVTRSTSNNKI